MGTRGARILSRIFNLKFIGTIRTCAQKMRENQRKLGPLAQSVEQRTFNPWVVGSIPTGPTEKILNPHEAAAVKSLPTEGAFFISCCSPGGIWG